MKFCAVLGAYPKDTPGGAEVQSYEICRELARRGHDVHYVARRSDGSGVTTDEQITVHRLRLGLKDTLSYLKEIQADVYYFRNKKDITIASFATRYLNGEIIYNIAHDYQCHKRFAPWPGKEDLYSLSNLYSRLRLIYWRTLLPIPDQIFTSSKKQTELLRQNRDIESTVLGKGQQVPSENYIEKYHPPVVLWLASLKDWKQPEIFIDVAESCTDLDCEFWIVGRPVDKEVRKVVENRTKNLVNISYKGGCSYVESNEYFEKASVYLNTSVEGGEGSPFVFVQAWLRETPVISLHADNNSGLLKEKGGTLLEDESELEPVIRKYINDVSYRKKMAIRAKEFGTEHFDIRTVCNRLEDAIHY